MTYGSSGGDPLDDQSPSGAASLSKNERREAARNKAKALRDQQRKKDRRSRHFLQGGLFVVVVAIIAIIAFVITSGIRPPTPGPKNMLSDGIKIGQGFTATKTAALQPDDSPVPSATNKADVIDIQVYLDYQCPICGQFETTNAAQIKTYLKTGAATIEIHPISILDNLSLGTKYSTRAANSAACVANYSPDSFFDYNAVLFDNQPKENTAGLTDAKLVSLVKKTSASHIDDISKCITDESFKAWVAASTTRATNGPIAGSNVKSVTGTPTVIINGSKYVGAVDDANSFAAAIVKAAGDTFANDSEASPSPSPSASVAP